MPVCFVCSFILLNTDAHAWLPSGWVWSQGPYAFAADTASWFYLNEGDQQSVYNYAPDVGWEFMEDSGLADGWAWYSWPFAYDAEELSWFYFDTQSEQWIYNASTDVWTRLGAQPVTRSPLLTFVIAPGFSTRRIALEWVTQVDLIETAHPERSGSVLVVVQSSASNPLGSSYDQLSALETDAFFTSSLLGRYYHIYRYDWTTNDRLIASYHHHDDIE